MNGDVLFRVCCVLAAVFGALVIVCEWRCPFSCVLCVSFPLGQRAGGIHAPFPILLSSWPRAGGIDAAFFLSLL